MQQFQPFYMTYRPEIYFDEDSMCRRDYNYMKSTYPDMAKRLRQRGVDEKLLKQIYWENALEVLNKCCI